jgi:sulfur-oxidizing protein SoxX
MRASWLAVLFAAFGMALGAQAAEPIVAYTVTNGSEIADSLTGAPGDAGRGRLLYAQEERAGCPACHGMPGADIDPTPASNLAGIGERMNAGAIRLWIVAAQAIDANTSMPAYYAPGQRDDPDDPLYGGPALTAAEIEDLVAYLLALRNLE